MTDDEQAMVRKLEFQVGWYRERVEYLEEHINRVIEVCFDYVDAGLVDEAHVKRGPSRPLC
jgi:hypothetical protein